MKFQTAVLSGRRPLRKLFLLGPQTACCTNACSNTVPVAASL
eukprot:COSAG01_NODE_63080_length_281_cov_1.120879_1_plen_41_part_01